MSGAKLVVEGLNVCFGRGEARRSVVRELSFTLERGRALALVGESGSGKSVTARSLVGLAGDGAQVGARTLRYGERDLLACSEREWRALRGRDIGFVLQDALVSLDPVRPVGREIEEALSVHRWGDRMRRRARVLELLAQVGVPEPALRARQRPGELSGGLRQRALIASALAMGPGVVIADEPTTALDATVQAQVVAQLVEIKRRGAALLVISHDLALVAQLADEVLVMRQGEVLEQGPVGQVLRHPRHGYTRSLLAAMPGIRGPGPGERRAAPADGEAVLEVRRIGKAYRGPDRVLRPALEEVSFELRAGSTLGVVGESGSGKSTLARIVLGLTEPDAGEVRFGGERWTGDRRHRVAERERRRRRRAMSAVYQDPLSTFDPRWSVGRILADALDVGGIPRERQRVHVARLLEQVRLSADCGERRPLQLSGGQRQRVAIARALASRPRLIVCDEPVSALDVSVQAQVLELLAELQAELGLAYLFISHDLGVIRQVSHDVLVMCEGRIVESGPVARIFAAPRHAYTRQLLAAAPRLELPA